MNEPSCCHSTEQNCCNCENYKPKSVITIKIEEDDDGNQYVLDDEGNRL